MPWRGQCPNILAPRLDNAGKTFISSDPADQGMSDALGVINNWRASHQYPLNTFQVTLRKKSRKVSPGSFVSQRIKRLESIRRKLSSGSIKLSQMQDIGGCRAVIESASDLPRLRELYRVSEFGHSFKNEKDYLHEPKTDGYRGWHIIYRYRGTTRTNCYDNLQIEVQIRSPR
jgi:ppGpp synthetase/RelA/SpoT-type nucleotidyltranferase